MIDIFAKPLGALLKLIFNFLLNIGMDFERISAFSMAIIITTIVFKLILLPLTMKQNKSMKGMQEIQPKLKELQTKYKNDPQTLNAKTVELYKEHNVSPFGGCLPLLIQFPIIIAFFRVMQTPVGYVFENQAAYDAINKSFLWIKDIALAPNVMVDGVMNGVQMFGYNIPILAIIAAATTYFATKMMSSMQQSNAQNEQAQSTQKMMSIMMPLLILWMGAKYAAGLTLYWGVSNIFQIVHQYIGIRSLRKVKEGSN